MARERSPVCDFIFSSLCTCILTDTVDVELTIRMVKGIYTYCKDHTAESTVFSPWTKNVIPFPSLRWKIQAFQDDNSKQMTTWNTSMTPKFFATLKQHQSPRKCAPGKPRTRCNRLIFSRTEPNLCLEDKTLPVYNMASSCLWKMFSYIIL